MVKPVNRKPIKFGGVTLDANQIKSKKVERGLLGNAVYTIEFKTGVKARYEQQATDRMPALNSYPSEYNDEIINGSKQQQFQITEGWDIKGLTIEGSKDYDQMIFKDCEQTIVDNHGDGKKDNVHFDNGKCNLVFDD